MNPKNFFAELKRRNVYKVAIAYAVVAWLLIQIAVQVSLPGNSPGGVARGLAPTGEFYSMALANPGTVPRLTEKQLSGNMAK